MKKKLQKITSLLALMVVIITQSIAVNAANNASMKLIPPDIRISEVTFSEYDLLKDSLSKEEMNQLVLEKIMQKSNKGNRFFIGLDVQDLTVESIDSLSDAQIRSLGWASCTLYHWFLSHDYNPNLGQYGTTEARIGYTWSWDEKPVFTFTDIIGFGWQADNVMTIDPSGSYSTTSYYTVHNPNVFGTNIGEVTNDFKQYQGGCVSDNIDFEKAFFPGHGEVVFGYAKTGWGILKLTTSGECINVAVSYRYGHKRVTVGSPSIAYPWGISFAFSSVSDTYEHEIQASHLK
jgi:hypothetical protein